MHKIEPSRPAKLQSTLNIISMINFSEFTFLFNSTKRTIFILLTNVEGEITVPKSVSGSAGALIFIYRNQWLVLRNNSIIF